MTKYIEWIHRFIPGAGPQTLLLLHGTGGNEDDLLPLGRDLCPEAGLLSPRGRVLENGMPRFFRRLGPGVFDEEDLERRTGELAGLVSDAVDAYGLDPQRIVALGYSNGANIAASLLLRHPGRVRAAALLHAMVPFEPGAPAGLRGTDVLITAGREDPMVPGDQAERLAQILGKSGARVRLEWLPGGHELTKRELEVVGDWFNFLTKEVSLEK